METLAITKIQQNFVTLSKEMYIVRKPKVAMGAPLTVTRALLACRFQCSCGKGFTKLISAPLSRRNNKPDSLSIICGKGDDLTTSLATFLNAESGRKLLEYLEKENVLLLIGAKLLGQEKILLFRGLVLEKDVPALEDLN